VSQTKLESNTVHLLFRAHVLLSKNFLAKKPLIKATFYASRVNSLQNAYVIVLVTTASKQEAEKIAHHLLKQRLIACANIIGPVSSLFHWSGKLENAEEYLIFMKSRRDLFDKLAETVKALHSYEVPEILVLPIVGGSKEYLAWLGSCLEPSKP
jgi:periplasmic divalent cation tolerance protein